ncbi:MAG: hypothetical protein KDC72_09385, partial [Bacteroidetes bacterium]|nr:hypothetical protein [Bacteroidota bacterium]
NNMFIFKFLYDEIYGFSMKFRIFIKLILKLESLDNFTWSPSQNYEQAYNSSPNSFTSSMSDFYGENPVSYEKSCIWNAKESIDSLEGEVFKPTYIIKYNRNL